MTEPAVLARTADLRAGVWRTIAVDPAMGDLPVFWDTDDTFLVWSLRTPAVMHRCTTAGTCVRVVLPTFAAGVNPSVVQRYGG